MSEFEDLRTRLEASEDANSEMFLGRLVWYSISDLRVKHEEVVRGLVNAGIDSQLPPPPKDSDVFRRVCSAAKKVKVATPVDGVFENYLIRDVGKDNGKVVRRIVVEQVDSKGKKLAYEQLVDVEFDRLTSKVTYKTVNALITLTDALAVAQNIAAGIQSEFAIWQGHLNSYAVREWIRHFILNLGATIVRPGGGVYFVKEDYAEKIEALEKFVASLPGECFCHSLPLIDDRKQRLMLQKAYEAETSDEIDALLTEIVEIRNAGTKITESRYADFLAKYHALTEKTTDYGSLLEQKLDSTNSRLDIFQQNIVKLLECVKH